MLKFGIIGLWIRSAVTGPLGFVLFFSVIYYFARRFKKKKTGTGFKSQHVVLAFSSFLLFLSLPYPAFILEKPLLVWAHHLADSAAINKRDTSPVIFVLGGGFSKKTGIPTSYTMARISHGLDLYSEYPDAYFLFSDAGLGKKTKTSWMMNYLEASGVKTNHILLENEAVSTQQNILYGKVLLMKRGLVARDLFLVTSASHLARATLTARHYGLAPIPDPVPESSNLTCYPSWHSVVHLSAVLHEYMGILGYKLLGWL